MRAIILGQAPSQIIVEVTQPAKVANSNDDFPFSFYRSRDEWESENRRREKFSADFERHWEHRENSSPEEESSDAKLEPAGQ